MDFICAATKLHSIMANWLADYHHMLLFRLLSTAVVFGVLWPGLWLLRTIGYRAIERLAPRISRRAQGWHGRLARRGARSARESLL
jgi:hypothetical protein